MSVDLCKVPAGAPPAGVTSNFIDPPSLAAATIGINAILVALGIIFTVAKFHTNFRRLNVADCEYIHQYLEDEHRMLLRVDH